MISGEGESFTLKRFSGTDDEVRAQWLKERGKGIGGSDVAAIMGLSPWRSPYEVWLEKTGMREPEDISGRPSVEWGNRLEPIVGQKFREEHPDWKVRRVNGILTSISRPWAKASLDYEVDVPGEGWQVLEIKTASQFGEHNWEEGVPLFYQTQVQHYLAVTGRKVAYVAVLIGGSDYREYRLERDEDDIRAIESAVDTFWLANVTGLTEPDVVGSDSPLLFDEHPAASGELVIMDSTPTALSRYQLACVEFEQAKAEKERWGAKLKQAIGDDRGWDTPSGKVVWQRGQRSRFDSKRFKAEHPDLNAKYTTTADVDGGIRVYPVKN